ncbi:RNA polymerase sigma factor [Skermania sp. ID1734]|uniref:RNA polymerase sigma factor n=1 Tax=Skermania sp. ID1734 TaxID=2597516 RepID=UPI00117EB072|nr:RNA polymerase sigma factor [Skermania sp. ID1734]TSE01239.1 RNA polymerase sigma factor [Skermania sp. ID1734]
MMLPPFETIVARHGPAVLRVCRALVGPTDAEDAWSETFLSALRAYPGLPADSNIEAWLVTIARRKALDVIDSRRRQRRVIEDLPPPTRPTTDGAVWEAVAALPLKQREAIAYHHLVGLPYAEVAVILGNNEAAARRAAADGMRTLRKTLDHKDFA